MLEEPVTRRPPNRRPSPATRRDRDPWLQGAVDRDVVGVLSPGLDVDHRDCATAVVANHDGLAVWGYFHRGRVEADGDVGRVLGPGLHINRRDRVAAEIGNEGGFAIRGDHDPGRLSADRDVVGVLLPGPHVECRHPAHIRWGSEERTPRVYDPDGFIVRRDNKPGRERADRITVPCLAIPSGHRRQGVIATTTGARPTGMSSGCLVLVFTSIVDTVSLSLLATKAVLPSGVIATPVGARPTGMSSGCFVRVCTSMVDTLLLSRLTTNAVLPSGENTGPNGAAPTRMSLGCLVLVFTSIVDTVPLM